MSDYAIRKLRAALDCVQFDSGLRYPWRMQSDPFAILLAEVLLQRTTGSHVARAYSAILRVAPTPTSFAAMDPTDLARMVSCLGLRKRVPVLSALAKSIIDRHGGIVPSQLDALMGLPGVGRYTAAAVRCFAFGLSEPLVDIGIGRVLRRALGLDDSGRRINEDQALWRMATRLLGRRNARSHNLALLAVANDFCKAKPKCSGCPLNGVCAARKHAA